jgi:hypothetical protein
VPETSLLAPILSGVFAFVGVLLAQAVVVWTQRKKVFDEDMRRWQEERRTLYARFVSEADAIAHRIHDAHETNKPSKLPNIYDPEDYRIEALLNEILLIASPEVVEAAQELDARVFIHLLETWRWVTGAGDLEDAQELASMDQETQSDLAKDPRTARTKFLQIARKELMEPSSMKGNKGFILFSRADTDSLARKKKKKKKKGKK